jgi:hypothetical protein
METESSRPPTVSTCWRYAPITRRQRLGALWIAAFLAVVASLIWLPAAQGKGLESVTACGADRCREMKTARVHRAGFKLLEVAWEGRSGRAPKRATDWYRIDFGWFHDEPAAIKEVVLPVSLDRIGYRQRGRARWVTLGNSRNAARYVALVEGLTPFSAQSFPSRLGVPGTRSVEARGPTPWSAAVSGGLAIVTAFL